MQKCVEMCGKSENEEIKGFYEPKGRGFESLLAYQMNRFFRKDEPVFLFYLIFREKILGQRLKLIHWLCVSVLFDVS